MNGGRGPLAIPRGVAAAAIRQTVAEEGYSYFPPGMEPAPIVVHEPGGDLVRGLVHPSMAPFERVERVLPEEAWYDPDVNPRAPVQFEIDAFPVPKDTALWLTDYEFTVFRMSGVDPGDFFAAEDGRFSGVMGFDLTFSARRPGNILYQLDPVPVQTSRPTFEPTPGGGRASPAQFNRAASNSFGSTSGQGQSLLPVWNKTQGPRQGPFCYVATQGDRVSMSCVIFRTVPSPLATVQSRMAGWLVPTNFSEEIMKRVRPR